jgi:hypothetical protein
LGVRPGRRISHELQSGDYGPDTTAAPYASRFAYQARPLNGIWAMAPYLHNGSIPTLYDLLLPKKCGKEPKNRPMANIGPTNSRSDCASLIRIESA